MTKILPLVLLLVSCTTVDLKPHPYVVTQYPPDPVVAEQAQELVTAAKTLAPGNEYLEFGGSITVSQGDEWGVGRLCYSAAYAGPWVIYGCGLPGDIEIQWPIPGQTGTFAEHSALAHELGHVIQDGGTEDQASAWALLIVQEWRKEHP